MADITVTEGESGKDVCVCVCVCVCVSKPDTVSYTHLISLWHVCILWQWIEYYLCS